MERTRLRTARAKKHWTLEKAAEAIGVGVTTLHQWEKGRANPYPFNRERLCEVYGATAAELDLEEDIETSKEVISLWKLSERITGENDKAQEETLSSLYEDMLIMSWDSFRRSKSLQTITKIDEHVNKLHKLTSSASIGEETHWQSLLCRFSQLSTRIAQHRLDEPRALQMAKQAILIAINLDDSELIASAFYHRHIVHMELINTAKDEIQKQKHAVLAKTDIDAALAYVEYVRSPLAGNIYLTAAEIYARIAGSDAVLRTQCERWQDKVALLVYSDKIEDDGTFLKLNATALHHERAKLLLRFGKIEEAKRELQKAWETLQPNLFTWQMNMLLTQATLFVANHEIEESTKAGLRAYTLAKTIHSHKGEVEVQRLIEQLQQIDKKSHHVQKLMTIVRGSI